MTMRAINNRRRWAAFHEAGHAVVRMVRMGVATGIGINIDGSGYSHGTYERHRATDIIEIDLAGPLAEARVRKISAFSVYLSHGAEDFAEAKSITDKLATVGGWGNACAIWTAAELSVGRWLRMYWPEVERIAAAALTNDSGRLTATQVAQLAAIDHMVIRCVENRHAPA